MMGLFNGLQNAGQQLRGKASRSGDDGAPEGSEPDDSWLSVASEASLEDPSYAAAVAAASASMTSVAVKLSDSRPQSLTPPLLYPDEVFMPPLPTPAAVLADAQNHLHHAQQAQMQQHYFETADPTHHSQRAVPTESPLSDRSRGGGKKRRLAPAPPSQVPGVPVMEPPRLYGNHLETG